MLQTVRILHEDQKMLTTSSLNAKMWWTTGSGTSVPRGYSPGLSPTWKSCWASRKSWGGMSKTILILLANRHRVVKLRRPVYVKKKKCHLQTNKNTDKQIHAFYILARLIYSYRWDRENGVFLYYRIESKAMVLLI